MTELANSLLQQLEAEILQLRKSLDDLAVVVSSIQTRKVEQSTSKAEFFSNVTMEEPEQSKKDILNDKLSSAAELSIEDYRKNPPKRR